MPTKVIGNNDDELTPDELKTSIENNWCKIKPEII